MVGSRRTVTPIRHAVTRDHHTVTGSNRTDTGDNRSVVGGFSLQALLPESAEADFVPLQPGVSTHGAEEIALSLVWAQA